MSSTETKRNKMRCDKCQNSNLWIDEEHISLSGGASYTITKYTCLFCDREIHREGKIDNMRRRLDKE